MNEYISFLEEIILETTSMGGHKRKYEKRLSFDSTVLNR
jgi:hypothetical protein